MNAVELQKWLSEHADEIFAFTDYEAIMGFQGDLCENLETCWFRDPCWNEPGYRFLPLGQDGSGGDVAIWLSPRPGNESCVVFFGSEGGRGVLTDSALAFAQALAYAPVITEYAKATLDAPSYLSIEDNWYFSGEIPDQAATARTAITTYRRAVEERFGPLPPFETLATVSADLQAEFCAWVSAVQERVADRDQRAQELAAQEKRQALRNKAAVFAARSAGSLPTAGSSHADGTRVKSTCSSCGKATTCRVTRFEELIFGLCADCYFSNA